MKTSIRILFVLVAILFGWLGYVCYCELEFNPNNSTGLIVSALGVMVTALVGWQVFNAIEIRGLIDRINEVKDGLDTIANEHRDKISRMEWLVSALHGTTFERKTFEGGDTAYFLHCLDVVGNFIKSGAPLNNPPFVNTMRNLESTFYDIKKRNDPHQILTLGANKDFVRRWYNIMITTIDAEAKHLSEIKERLGNMYEDYIVLTKDVKIEPQEPKSSKIPPQTDNIKNTKKGKEK